MRIEFFIEEPSMEVFLKIILPKIFPETFQLNENYFIRTHQGKSDLKKSLRTKIKAYYSMGQPVGIIVLHDQDSNDCKLLKDNLKSICPDSTDVVKCLIRIVCRELESWYLGDLKAIEKSYNHFNSSKYLNKSKFRNPDNLNSYHELRKLVPSFQKVEGAGKISPNLKLDENRSISFNHFVTGVKKFYSEYID